MNSFGVPLESGWQLDRILRRSRVVRQPVLDLFKQHVFPVGKPANRNDIYLSETHLALRRYFPHKTPGSDVRVGMTISDTAEFGLLIRK